MPTSQNGWPVLQPDSPKLYPWVVPGYRNTMTMRNGSAGFLLTRALVRIDNRIEPLDGPIRDDWPYAFRPIRGFAEWSNHASGTAFDVNALQHGLGGVGTFTREEERRIDNMLDDLFHGAIRWGGDYKGRKDEMHFEIVASLNECERLARKLMDTPVGKTILAANPGQRKVILS